MQSNSTENKLSIIKNPPESQWDNILRRPVAGYEQLQETVRTILEAVKCQGDRAMKDYEMKFDQVRLTQLRVTEKEIAEAEKEIPEELKKAILTAKANIEKFHIAQRTDLPRIETTPGVVCWQKAVPVEKVGLYIPGGTAPLFSTVLMLAVPAKIAGCREIVLCSPPDREGKIHPAILYAATVSGVDKIFKAGGVQAIGAMAYGTETIPKMYKIFGPGNQYVTTAKQLVSLRDVAIDMPAGPSEVEVIADETANPAFVAADLLSQAEHGIDSQSILVTNSLDVAEKVAHEVVLQLETLPRKEIAGKAMANSRIIVLQTWDEIISFTNRYAPEHLIIETHNYNEIADRVINAGSVFLGHYSTESAGDYASGTNHTLPTNGYARAYSGVNLDSFLKKITFQELSKEGIRNLGETIQIMAEHEALQAHKNAVTLRIP
jgi:histidinol dehydrogenase